MGGIGVAVSQAAAANFDFLNGIAICAAAAK